MHAGAFKSVLSETRKATRQKKRRRKNRHGTAVGNQREQMQSGSIDARAHRHVVAGGKQCQVVRGFACCQQHALTFDAFE